MTINFKTSSHIASILTHAARTVRRGSTLKAAREYMHYQLVTRVEAGQVEGADVGHCTGAFSLQAVLRSKADFLAHCDREAAYWDGVAKQAIAAQRAAKAARETAPAEDVDPLTRYDLEQAATYSDTPAEDAAKQEALRTFDASHLAGTAARLAISCLDHVGREGSFLYIERNGERVAVSPIFASVLGVFDWCAAHGWTGDDRADVFTKDETTPRRQPVKVENVRASTLAIGLGCLESHVYPAGQAPQDAKYSIKVTHDALSRPQYGSHQEIVQERIQQIAPQVKPYEMRRVTITGPDRVNLYLDGDKVGTITATPSTVWNGRPKDDPAVVTLDGKRWEFDTETAAIEWARAQLKALTVSADEENAEIMESEGRKALAGIAAAVDALMCVDHDRYPAARQAINQLEDAARRLTGEQEDAPAVTPARVDAMRAALDLLDSGERQARTRAADILRAALENDSTKC